MRRRGSCFVQTAKAIVIGDTGGHYGSSSVVYKLKKIGSFKTCAVPRRRQATGSSLAVIVTKHRHEGELLLSVVMLLSEFVDRLRPSKLHQPPQINNREQ